MGLLDRIRSWRAPALPPAPAVTTFLPDLPLRREAASATAAAGALAIRQAQESIGLTLPFNQGMDADENLYRRLTGDAKMQRRDLAPLAQDRMIEIAYFLWEQNALARRLIVMMTDLMIGEGVKVEATDERNQEVIDRTWNHRENKLQERIRSFHNALSLNGELALPVAINPISGVPRLGFIDPWQIKQIETLPDNILVPDVMVLKPNSMSGEKDGQRLKIVRENPETERLEGEVFYFAINNLPNGLRGRSDLNALADWLDLYDQYMFGEVERLTLLSTFVWDYKIDGADEPTIKAKLAKFPNGFKSGQVFAHNEKESVDARTPDLKAADRSEVARLLRVHIAGSMGFPVSYLGDIDSNHSTIEGQNDVLMKTPAARQKEFASFIDQIVRFSVESAQVKNPALFRDVQQGYVIRMPEISAKDITRAGSAISQVISGMDVAMANRTMSRRAAVVVQAAIIKHLGVELDPAEVEKQADEDQAAADDKADEMAAQIAAGNAAGAAGRPGPGGRTNPPIPNDPQRTPPAAPTTESQVEPEILESIQASVDALADRVEDAVRRPMPAIHHHAGPVTVNTAPVTVEGSTVNVAPAAAPNLSVTVPPAPVGKRKLKRESNGDLTISEAE